MSTSVSLRCYAELHEQCNVPVLECACRCHQREPRLVPPGDWRARAKQAEALVGRLRQYVGHQGWCTTNGATEPCLCGLDALLADPTGARLADQENRLSLYTFRLQTALQSLLETLTRFACAHVTQDEVDRARALLIRRRHG